MGFWDWLKNKVSGAIKKIEEKTGWDLPGGYTKQQLNQIRRPTQNQQTPQTQQTSQPSRNRAPSTSPRKRLPKLPIRNSFENLNKALNNIKNEKARKKSSAIELMSQGTKMTYTPQAVEEVYGKDVAKKYVETVGKQAQERQKALKLLGSLSKQEEMVKNAPSNAIFEVDGKRISKSEALTLIAKQKAKLWEVATYNIEGAWVNEFKKSLKPYVEQKRKAKQVANFENQLTEVARNWMQYKEEKRKQWLPKWMHSTATTTPKIRSFWESYLEAERTGYHKLRPVAFLGPVDVMIAPRKTPGFKINWEPFIKGNNYVIVKTPGKKEYISGKNIFEISKGINAKLSNFMKQQRAIAEKSYEAQTRFYAIESTFWLLGTGAGAVLGKRRARSEATNMLDIGIQPKIGKTQEFRLEYTELAPEKGVYVVKTPFGPSESGIYFPEKAVTVRIPLESGYIERRFTPKNPATISKGIIAEEGILTYSKSISNTIPTPQGYTINFVRGYSTTSLGSGSYVKGLVVPAPEELGESGLRIFRGVYKSYGMLGQPDVYGEVYGEIVSVPKEQMAKNFIPDVTGGLPRNMYGIKSEELLSESTRGYIRIGETFPIAFPVPQINVRPMPLLSERLLTKTKTSEVFVPNVINAVKQLRKKMVGYRIGELTTPSLKTITINLPSIKTIPLTVTTPSTSTRSALKTMQILEITPEKLTPPAPAVPSILPAGGVKLPGFFVPPSKFWGGGGRGIESFFKKIERMFKYQPSFTAKTLKIFGAKPKKKWFSGFELRPIPKRKRRSRSKRKKR